MSVLPIHPLQTCRQCAAEYDPSYAVECCAGDDCAPSPVCPGCRCAVAPALLYATAVAFEMASSSTPSS